MYKSRNLKKIKNIKEGAPDAMAAFVAFDKLAMAEGAIPKKYKELIALAVTFTTQCAYCIEVHSASARRAGVTDVEISEAIAVTMTLRAGGALAHGTHAFESEQTD
ncbi:MAG: carboxymuconolactone decarboxylase family protein [Rhodospirillales bacterium]|nr:carboxymuconolactone decarboxylase family protein [Rhodospirillales bacterium]